MDGFLSVVRFHSQMGRELMSVKWYVHANYGLYVQVPMLYGVNDEVDYFANDGRDGDRYEYYHVYV